MKCQSDIEEIASEKLIDAECLLDNARFDSAYYLAGYSVELYLKAKVCKTLGVPNFFDFTDTQRIKIKNVDVLYKPYRTHNYEHLLLLSGIYTAFDDKLNNDNIFKLNWSIVNNWDEGSRYIINRNHTDCITFVESVKEIIRWIGTHL